VSNFSFFIHQFHKFLNNMSEVKYDSVLVGFAEEPRHTEDGQLMGWSVRFKDHELKEIAEKYATSRNEQGQGGNVYFTMFVSKNGKSCCRVFDPNSAAAKEKRAAKQAAAEAVADDMPF
jgi:hypothetical protein|tara:strand:- start:27 stop:383 length:357 start_codon:yes stop_codon:yes gene_type:complete